MTPDEIELRLLLMGFTEVKRKNQKSKIFSKGELRLTMYIKEKECTFLLTDSASVEGIRYYPNAKELFKVLMR